MLLWYSVTARAVALGLCLLLGAARAEIYWGLYDEDFDYFVPARLDKTPSLRVIQMTATGSLDVNELVYTRDSGMIPLLEVLPYDPAASWDAWALGTIADGAHDAEFKRIAETTRYFNHPMFLSFAPWMNTQDNFPWSLSYAGGEFVRAWRHVWGIFNQSNASMVNWVFNPVASHNSDPYALKELYPGDEFVDWVGAEVVNSILHWHPFTTHILDSYTVLQSIAPLKPLLVTAACAEDEVRKRTWIRAMMQNEVTTMKRIKALVWRNYWLDHEDFRLDSGEPALNAFNSCIRGQYYSSNYFSHINEIKIKPLTPL